MKFSFDSIGPENKLKAIPIVLNSSGLGRRPAWVVGCNAGSVTKQLRVQSRVVYFWSCASGHLLWVVYFGVCTSGRLYWIVYLLSCTLDCVLRVVYFGSCTLSLILWIVYFELCTLDLVFWVVYLK